MKAVAIWILGLFGSGLTAGLLGEMIHPESGGILGVMAGTIGFTCFRLLDTRVKPR